MLIFDDILRWDGFGGKLRLASGKCKLRIYDLNRGDSGGLVHLKPVVVVATDLADSKMTVRSCCGHIATTVVRNHHIVPCRMQFIEHYPETFYGRQTRQCIPQKFDAVEFKWEKGLALHATWQPLDGSLLDFLRDQFKDSK